MPQPPPDVTPAIAHGDLEEEQLAAYLASPEIAVDTETLGLNPLRDRLCLVQLCDRAGRGTLVQIRREDLEKPLPRAPRLRRLLEEPRVLKVFHFARFDVATIRHHLGIQVAPLYCTRTASKLVRTYTDRHGLKDLVKELLSVDLSKQQQSSDWGADALSEAQLAYAASDVLHLHALRGRLDAMLKREGRDGHARAAFAYLPDRVRLDLAGFEAMDVFAHASP
jgi:ribonuclease D